MIKYFIHVNHCLHFSSAPTKNEGNDLMNKLGGNNNSMITCFDNNNLSYKTWNIDDKKKNKLNFIILNNDKKL